jgi:hypothetical protein
MLRDSETGTLRRATAQSPGIEPWPPRNGTGVQTQIRQALLAAQPVGGDAENGRGQELASEKLPSNRPITAARHQSYAHRAEAGQ